MPWNGVAPNQSYGRTDGTRTGDTTWNQANAAGVKIVTSGHDAHDTDMKDGLNATLKKDGGNTATANIPMGGNTLTNIANAAARTSPASFADVADNKGHYVAAVGGTADAITLTPTIAIAAYAAGQRFQFLASGTNTAAVTVNVSGLGVKSITNRDAAFTALAAGSIVSGTMQDIEYDGTRFQSVSASSITITSGQVITGLGYTPAGLGANAFAGTQTISTAAPVLIFDQTDGAATEKRWWIVADGAEMRIDLLTDASAFASTAFTLTRVGTAISTANFPNLSATGLQRAGNVVWDQANAGARVNALTEDASPDSANDFVLSYDTSATASKKVKISNLATPPVSGSGITVAGSTVSINTNNSVGIGAYVTAYNASGSAVGNTATIAGSSLTCVDGSSGLTGTWRNVSGGNVAGSSVYTGQFIRTA